MDSAAPGADPAVDREDAVLVGHLGDRSVPDVLAVRTGRTRFDEFDLTSQQHSVLGLIVTEPDITPLGLAKALGVTKGAISQHLNSLEQRGYIQRQRSDRDRRVRVLRLQAVGERYQQRWREFENYTLDRYLSKLTAADLTEIVAALSKLKCAFAD